MFEAVVSLLINKYLGKYIHNLNSSSLNLSIFNGDVELKGLQLKPEALVELDLPIEVKAGYVGLIKFAIPWTRLFSTSIHVELQDVYVLAGPISDRQYDPELERGLQNAIKRQMLEALQTSMVKNVVNTADENPGFFEKVYTYIINNLQVSISNIHVRYEDTVTNPDHPFACGLMLKHLKAHTTDSRWQRAQVDSSSTLIHKLLSLEELSVYWNPYVPEQHLLKSRLNTDGWRNLLKTAIDSHQIFEEDFDFIVEPVSAQTRVIISKDNNLTMPKFFSDITLQEIEILLSRQQFLNLLSLNDSFKLMRINQRYRKYHPNVLLKISPRSWWQYAYNAIVEEFIRQYSWERIKEHRIKYRKYKELYKKSLEHPDHESIKSKLRELEEGLDVGNILMAREQAKSEFAPERVKKKKKEKGWFSSWFGGSSDEEDVEIKVMKDDGDWLSQLSVEEKNRLYQGIGYDVNAKTFKMSREYIENKVQVNLKSCSLSLVNYSKKILQISVTQMLGSWETRPAGNASRISCNTESFSIEGTSIEHELVPIVTSDVNVYAPSVNQVFTLDFETNPVYTEADFSLKMNIQPVEVVYDEHSVTEVKAFFQLPAKVNLDMNSVAMETFNQVANKSKIALIYAIEQHKTIHLAVNMKSPYIVIPEFGTLHRGGNVLIVDLGMLQVKSELQPKDVSLEDITMSEIGARLYDQFNVSITDVKVLLADSGDDWHTAQVQSNSQYHILPSMQLNMDFYNTVKPDYKDLPQQKVITTLPRFEINISDKRLNVLYKFFRNFPFPSSTSMVTLAEDAVDGANIPRAASVLNLRECQLEPSVAQLKRIKRAVLGRHLVDDTKVSKKKDDETVVRQLSDMADLPRINRDEQEEEDWSSFSEVKPVDDDSSGSNSINILLRFNVREMVVQLNRSFDRLEKPYLMFRADRFHLDAAITAHGVAAHSSLGAVQLVDKIHTDNTGAYMELLTTMADTDLITLTYRKVEASCPDFEAVYGGVEQGVEFNFHSLHILLDQGAVMYMKSFLNGLLASLQSVDMVVSTTSTMVSSLASELTTQHLTPFPPSSRTEAMWDHPDSKGNQGSIVQLNILADLRSLSLTLSDNNSRVARLQVRDFHGHIIKRKEKFALSGQLKAVDIHDCSHGALYPNIMTLDDKDDSLINLTFYQYLEKEEQASRDNRIEDMSLDFRVNLKVGHLQLVAISKFYWELRKFVEPFISKDFMDTATVAMETVSRKVDSIQVGTTRFGIVVEMRSPTILVPKNSCSRDLILIDLGDLHIHNVFDVTEVNTGGKQEWNHIYVDLVSAQMRRVKLSEEDDDFHVISRIIEPISFKTDIRLTMDPQVSCVQTDISTKLDMVYGNLRKSDIQLVMNIINENWTEGAPQPEPELPLQQHVLHPQPSVESGNGTVIMDDLANSDTHYANKKSAAMVLFSFEGMQLDLYEESQEEKEMGGFAQLNLGKVSGSVSSTSDGEVKVSVSLETLTVTDVREDSKLAVKKILYYDEGNIKSLENIDSSRPLISLIYKIIGDGNTKADIMMERVIMNLHIPYLMMVVNFFMDAFSQPEQPNRKPIIAHPYRQVSTVPPSPVPVDPSQPRPVMTIYCTIKQPEIILFADHESLSSRILVINADIALEMVSSSAQQKILAKVSGLRMFCNTYAAPRNVATKLITPLDLEFSRCFEVNTSELEMSAKLPKFELHLTPANLRLLLDISQMLTQASNQALFPSKNDLNVQPKTDMWSVEPASVDSWIKKLQEVENNSPVFDVHQEASTETFHVAIEEVSAYLEVENLDYILPLLCVRSSLQANACNWTKQLRLKAELHVDVCYYNERLSTWEPFIEPVMEEEGSYQPWELVIQLFQAESYPIVCSYDDNGLDAPDGIQNEVEQMINKKYCHTSSSEVDEDEQADSPGEMTIIRPKVQKRRIRIASDKSYDSASLHSSIQGESDSEGDSVINSIANNLGGIFTSDSSDADISETDDNDDIFDPSLDKPIFLTPRGPIRFSVGPEEFDEVDGPQTVIEPQEDQKNTCNYIIFSSRDKLLLNITPHAINVLKDFIESLTKPESSTLHTARQLPAMEIDNKLGVDVDILLHPKVKVHSDYVIDCNVYYPGSNSGGNHRDIRENVELKADDEDEDIDEEDGNWDEIDAKIGFKKRGKTMFRFVDKLLTNSGNDLINTGTFVLNEEHDQYTFGGLDKDTMQIKVAGFDPITCVYKKACRRLLTLNPKQSGDIYDPDQVGIRYCLVFDVDVHHSNKTITVHSPLQLTNHLVMAIDVYCKTDELKKLKPNTQEPGEFTKIATVQPEKVCHLPLFIAYNLALYICPSDPMYKKCTNPVWWKDLVQTKDRQKFFMCYSQDGQNVLNIKIACEDGEPLQPPQTVPRTIPYFNICFYPPILLHNYLPYDLQYSLEGVTISSRLTHGEKCPLHAVDLQRSYKLIVGVSDYLGCDWKGALDISQDMEEFKAITMETDADDNDNKFLSLNVQFNLSHTWNLYIYSLYWIVNKTDLPIQIRGSLSDNVLECAPSSYPLLFRYKKHKRKKAKLKVFDSNWSHSFSLDTVGNCGVAICKHVQRKRKYMFMVQSQLSNLKLTKIITIMPFFIVVNSCSKPLRYMEENKETDLWFDLAVNQCSPFWPVTENFKMFVKYERSNIVSQHFPIKEAHNTVLRMEHGSALCVEVAGGTQTPFTILFRDYDVGDAPVRIENLCDDVFIKIHQKGQSQTSVLSANQKVLYTWDDPASERSLMWNVYGRDKPDHLAFINKDGYDKVTLKVKSLRVSGTAENEDSSPEDETDEMDGVVDAMSMSLLGKTRSDKVVIYWVSYLAHQQRVLLFTQDERIATIARKAHAQGIDIPHERGVMKMNEAEQATLVSFVSLDGLTVSVINGAYEEVALLSMTSMPAAWEVEVNNRWKLLNIELQTWLEDQWRNLQTKTSLQEQVEVNLDQMKMLRPYIGDLRRTYNPGLWFSYRHSKHHVSFQAKIHRIQIDNQLSDAYFPTVLYPSPVPAYIVKKKGHKPFLDFCFMRRTVPENNVDTFRYIKLLMQEFNISVDKGFLMSMYDVFSNFMPGNNSQSFQLQADLVLAQRSLLDVATVMVKDRPSWIFFEHLKLSPLKMHISFSLHGTVHESIKTDQTTIVSDIFEFFLSSVGATLTEMKDVELRMAYFERKGVFLSWSQLLSQAQLHYTQQAVQQVYVLILGLDVLGNPYGLLRDFTQGFGDLFYEPVLDSVQGSDQFADSLVRGVHSMLGNVIGGTASSLARITGSLGNALAVLSFDNSYKSRRRSAFQQKPSNLPLSLVLGGKSFVMGVCLGLSGVVLDPVKGAQEEGVEGFFKGVGKGIMGLLTKPTGGVLDMVSMAFDGMHRAAELEHGIIHRMRKPRFINQYLGLWPYSNHQAAGYSLLMNLNRGQFAQSDIYWAHAPLSVNERADVFLITDKNLILLQKRRCWGGWEVEWVVKVEDLIGVPEISANKMILQLKQEENKVNLFAGGEREISSSDAEVLQWIQSKIENLLRFRQQFYC
ncbi:hypothetical protein ACJMK2_028943 [Sinanodonta woodiana]|uniref:Vacuolar protein sorting-associated protein 13A n=1 Tax=Sinanodonta woodiana TaxID=1069815 RepID=A0ABD3XAX5_SINWO